MEILSRVIDNVPGWLGLRDTNTPVTPPVTVVPVEEATPGDAGPQAADVVHARSDFSEPAIAPETQLPAVLVDTPPVAVAVAVVAKEDRALAKIICRNLMSVGQIERFSVAQKMNEMTASVKACFIELASQVEAVMLDTKRLVPLGKVQIVILLLGEALAAEAAGRNPAASQSLLENLRREWAGGQTSVVKTDQSFVGEAFHIMVAAQLRHGRHLTFKVPDVAGHNLYAASFDNMVVAANHAAPPLSRAQARDIPDLSKKDLTALIVGGPTALPALPLVRDIQDGVYSMLTGGLSDATRQEIGDRSSAMLRNAGMRSNEPKLGIVIRNVKPGAGGGTVDTSNNMTRQRMRDCLHAAEQAGIGNIVFFGDALDVSWIRGTPWDPLLSKHGGEQRFADLTAAWSRTAATSPLHDSAPGLGPRRHLSDAEWIEIPPHGSPALQGGYAEQVCMYRELHQRENLLALVGNRSGAIDGPAFCGVPTIQMLVQKTEGEKVAGRLGLLPAIFPKYGLLNVQPSSRAADQAPGGVPLSESNLNDLSDRLRKLDVGRQEGAADM